MILVQRIQEIKAAIKTQGKQNCWKLLPVYTNPACFKDHQNNLMIYLIEFQQGTS